MKDVSVTYVTTMTLHWMMLTVTNTCHIKGPASVNQVSAKPDKKQLRQVETTQVRQQLNFMLMFRLKQSVKQH